MLQACHFFGQSLKRFLIYYIITGIGAAVCHYAVVYFQIQPTLEAVDSNEGFAKYFESKNI